MFGQTGETKLSDDSELSTATQAEPGVLAGGERKVLSRKKVSRTAVASVAASFTVAMTLAAFGLPGAGAALQIEPAAAYAQESSNVPVTSEAAANASLKTASSIGDMLMGGVDQGNGDNTGQDSSEDITAGRDMTVGWQLTDDNDSVQLSYAWFKSGDVYIMYDGIYITGKLETIGKTDGGTIYAIYNPDIYGTYGSNSSYMSGEDVDYIKLLAPDGDAASPAGVWKIYLKMHHLVTSGYQSNPDYGSDEIDTDSYISYSFMGFCVDFADDGTVGAITDTGYSPIFMEEEYPDPETSYYNLIGTWQKTDSTTGGVAYDIVDSYGKHVYLTFGE